MDSTTMRNEMAKLASSNKIEFVKLLRESPASLTLKEAIDTVNFICDEPTRKVKDDLANAVIAVRNAGLPFRDVMEVCDRAY